ncbi:MAG: transaldolase family protein, partial [Acidobacteriota bacterium]
MNPLKRLSEQGQSVWLDYIRRSLVTGGDLRRLINEDGLTGLTSNPSIFEKAIAGSNDYASSIQKLGADSGMDEKDLYERLAIEDIRLAADELLEVYQRTGGGDGFVSLEVSPHLAADTRGTVREARRLWKAIDRQNLMIKVPATPEGIPAFEELIAEAINVNVTLLFAREVYDRVAEAYLRGLDRLVENGGDPAGVASVASFFLSRIDTAIEAIAAERLAGSPSEGERNLFRNVLGKVGVANAKLAYQRYREIY